MKIGVFDNGVQKEFLKLHSVKVAGIIDFKTGNLLKEKEIDVFVAGGGTGNKAHGTISLHLLFQNHPDAEFLIGFYPVDSISVSGEEYFKALEYFLSIDDLNVLYLGMAMSDEVLMPRVRDLLRRFIRKGVPVVSQLVAGFTVPAVYPEVIAAGSHTALQGHPGVYPDIALPDVLVKAWNNGKEEDVPAPFFGGAMLNYREMVEALRGPKHVKASVITPDRIAFLAQKRKIPYSEMKKPEFLLLKFRELTAKDSVSLMKADSIGRLTGQVSPFQYRSATSEDRDGFYGAETFVEKGFIYIAYLVSELDREIIARSRILHYHGMGDGA